MIESEEGSDPIQRDEKTGKWFFWDIIEEDKSTFFSNRAEAKIAFDIYNKEIQYCQ
jgi:hypothetical protein